MYLSIHLFIYGPSAGSLDAESPKSKQYRNTKKMLVTKWALSFRICTIFCMREIVYISFGSRILLSPPRPQTRTKQNKIKLHFFNVYWFVYLWGSIWAMVTRPVQGPFMFMGANIHGPPEHPSSSAWAPWRCGALVWPAHERHLAQSVKPLGSRVFIVYRPKTVPRQI